MHTCGEGALTALSTMRTRLPGNERNRAIRWRAVAGGPFAGGRQGVYGFAAGRGRVVASVKGREAEWERESARQDAQEAAERHDFWRYPRSVLPGDCARCAAWKLPTPSALPGHVVTSLCGRGWTTSRAHTL